MEGILKKKKKKKHLRQGSQLEDNNNKEKIKVLNQDRAVVMGGRKKVREKFEKESLKCEQGDQGESDND